MFLLVFWGFQQKLQVKGLNEFLDQDTSASEGLDSINGKIIYITTLRELLRNCRQLVTERPYITQIEPP